MPVEAVVRTLLSALALVLSAPAAADELGSGTYIRIYYDDAGNWNDPTNSAGLQVNHGGTWVEYTYFGYPWQEFVLGYTVGGVSSSNYLTSYSLTTGAPDYDFTVLSETNSSTTSAAVVIYGYQAGPLYVEKMESWSVGGKVMRVNFLIVNDGTEDASGIELLFAVDPDQDAASTYTTDNDTLDLDG